MSLNRYFHWKCDQCGTTVLMEGYGLPKGPEGKWVYRHPSGEPVTHTCDACQKEKRPVFVFDSTKERTRLPEGRVRKGVTGLEQLFTVIQHQPTSLHPVGVRHEWVPLEIEK